MGLRTSFNPLGSLPQIPKVVWTVSNITRVNGNYVLPAVWNINNDVIQTTNCVVENAVENNGVYTVTLSYTYSDVTKTVSENSLSVTFTDSNFSNTNS